MKARNGFQTGKSGVFQCSECGKMTRDTGRDESGIQMCSSCIDIQEWANGISDGLYTLEDVPEEYRSRVSNFL